MYIKSGKEESLYVYFLKFEKILIKFVHENLAQSEGIKNENFEIEDFLIYKVKNNNFFEIS